MANPSRKSLRQTLSLATVMIVSVGIASVTLLLTMAKTPSAQDLQVGSVASQEIVAPYAITYTSDVMTEQRRSDAAYAALPQYTVADTSIARQQLDRLRAALAFISTVRADSYASQAQKLTDLAALQDVHLDQETATAILELTEPRWQAVQQEAVIVLERAMRDTIREDRLETTLRGIPSMVSLALPEDQAAIVVELVATLIAPNSFYSDSLTEAVRQQAMEAVEPVTVSYAAGETILRRGEKVTTTKLEAMQHLGLARPEIHWQDYASLAGVILLVTLLFVIYLRRKPELAANLPGVILVSGLFLIFLIGGRFALPLHTLMPYVYPVAAYALVVTVLIGAETALVTLIPLVILLTYGHPAAFQLLLYYGLSSLCGVLIPKREQRITAYVWTGFVVAVTGAATLTIYLLPESETTWNSLASLAGLALLNGLLVAGITVLLQYLLAPLLGQITPLQLLEISRPDHPLMEYLLHNAPGTYQHSLQVANLAEQAAEAIDADGLLTRVGALYHDVGKAQNPQFFIENQVSGALNTHEDLEPAESAAIIISHVSDGLRLAQQYHLPRRIRDFISEHHGTLLTFYQYTSAVKAAGGDKSLVDERLFKYPGPPPQSRETALLMLADSCEARVRAQRPPDEEALKAMIKEIIDKRVHSGQLAAIDFTLKDLDIITASFTATLRGIYHPRVEYPTLDVPTRPIPRLAVGQMPLEVEDSQPGPESLTQARN